MNMQRSEFNFRTVLANDLLRPSSSDSNSIPTSALGPIIVNAREGEHSITSKRINTGSHFVIFTYDHTEDVIRVDIENRSGDKDYQFTLERGEIGV